MSEAVARARWGLTIYLGVLVAGSAVLEFLLWRTHEPIIKHRGLVYLLMWVPAIASIVARLVLRENVRDLSFRFSLRVGLRPLLVAWLLPLGVGLAAYGFAWCLGLAVWSPPDVTIFGAHPESPLARFLLLLAYCMTAGSILSAFAAAGEEIGWRGYMLTRLIDARIRKPVLTSGLIWGAWHLPTILSGQYAAGPYPVFSATVFMVDIVVAAYFAAYVRLQSGSIWPAIVAHSSWNSIIQSAFDASTQGQSIWVGESGIFCALADFALVALVVRGPWAVKRSPGEANPLSVSAMEI